jgi:hypothetical protein
MGHFDRKNYIVVVKLKESCSDTRIINWQLEREFSYTVAEVNNFQSSIAPHHNPLAEKIVCFFSEYSNGVLLPNKWNTFEPIKHDYKASELNRYVAILAYPCGNLFLKNKKITCHIENCDFGFWWFDGKPCSPKISFDYLVEIRIFFSKQSKPKMDFMHKLADDMAKYFNTDYSKIIDQELASEMPPLYEKDPRAVIYDAVNP